MSKQLPPMIDKMALAGRGLVKPKLPSTVSDYLQQYQEENISLKQLSDNINQHVYTLYFLLAVIFFLQICIVAFLAK
ncbi:MAG: hypothetical protein KGV51_03465 [Moraxellaceae bacterium]|nr:hypothetical protein [Moraxellaceae bacterium]